MSAAPGSDQIPQRNEMTQFALNGNAAKPK